MKAWRRDLAITVLLAQLVSTSVHADDDDPSSVMSHIAAVAASCQQQENTLYLDVILNGEPTNSIVSFVNRAGQLWAQGKDLQLLGINVSDDSLINLATMSGLHYRYISNEQRLELRVADAIRAPYTLGRGRPAGVKSSSDTGLVMNYDAFAQGGKSLDDGSSLSVATEQRLFSPVGFISNTGVATLANGEQRYIRQSTVYQYEDPAALVSLDVGDTTSSALAWTRSVRMGGVQFRRDFGLSPDLVTFPLPQLGGSAALPSTVDLYVNNVRQLSSDVPSGPFVINGAATITGGGVATVIVRDSLGRAVSATLPIYVDSRLLAQGLSSYSMEAGLLRYNFGERSFDYEGNAAISGTYRYGVNDLVTFESHAEGTAGLADAGFGALLRLGNLGVFRASGIGSSGAGRSGEQATLGYQLVLPKLSITAQGSRALSNYEDLAGVSGTPPPRYQTQFSVSVPLAHERSIGTSYVSVRDAVAGHSTITAVWGSARLSRMVSAYLNLSRDLDQTRSFGAWLGISIDLGKRLSGFLNAGTADGHPTYGASIYQSADYFGGWGWSAQTNRTDNIDTSVFHVGYLGQYGLVSAAVQNTDGQSNATLEATGGLVFMDGVFEFSRRMNSSFALVSTDDVGGVSVLHENRLIGVTDSTGHLLVPDLNSYERNKLGIDTLNLPADTKIPLDALDVAPRGQSGVLAHFSISHYTAASITLVGESGAPLPAGSIVHHVESSRDFTVGYDGQAFIEDLKPQNHLLVTSPDFTCAAQFDYRRSGEKNGGLTDLGTLTCRANGVHQL